MSTAALPTLLGLRTELRLLIYDMLLKQSIEYEPLNFEPSTRGADVEIRDNKLQWPWIALSQTCWTIRSELASQRRLRRDRVWELDVRATSDTITSLVCRRLPCAPEEVEKLVMNYRLDAVHSPLASGFKKCPPGLLPWQLYQSLNHILHCGPQMTFTKILHTPVSFKVVVLRVSWRASQPPWNRGTYAQYTLRAKQWHNRRLRDFISMFCELGIGFGQVGKFRIESEGMETYELSPWNSGRSSVQAVPEHWKRAGFGWGITVGQYREGK